MQNDTRIRYWFVTHEIEKVCCVYEHRQVASTTVFKESRVINEHPIQFTIDTNTEYAWIEKDHVKEMWTLLFYSEISKEEYEYWKDQLN